MGDHSFLVKRQCLAYAWTCRPLHPLRSPYLGNLWSFMHYYLKDKMLPQWRKEGDRVLPHPDSMPQSYFFPPLIGWLGMLINVVFYAYTYWHTCEGNNRLQVSVSLAGKFNVVTGCYTQKSTLLAKNLGLHLNKITYITLCFP